MAAPANDTFSSAELLFGYVASTSGTNVDATAQAGEPDHAGLSAPNKSVWYKWRAPRDGRCHVDLVGSDFDTVLAVYTGSAVNALTEVESNDERDTPPNDSTSELWFLATEGTTYHIAVAGYAGATGNLSIALDFHLAVLIESRVDYTRSQGGGYPDFFVVTHVPNSGLWPAAPDYHTPGVGDWIVIYFATRGVPQPGGINPVNTPNPIAYYSDEDFNPVGLHPFPYNGLIIGSTGDDAINVFGFYKQLTEYDVNGATTPGEWLWDLQDSDPDSVYDAVCCAQVYRGGDLITELIGDTPSPNLHQSFVAPGDEPSPISQGVSNYFFFGSGVLAVLSTHAFFAVALDHSYASLPSIAWTGAEIERTDAFVLDNHYLSGSPGEDRWGYNPGGNNRPALATASSRNNVSGPGSDVTADFLWGTESLRSVIVSTAWLIDQYLLFPSDSPPSDIDDSFYEELGIEETS